MEIGAHATGVVQFQDLKHIELAMKVLGLMCDGQYRDMQNYLHEQKESIISVNMVGEVAIFLQQIFQSRNITPETIKALHQILQTLIEMCVGNFANQEVIFNKQIMTIINHVLQLDITNINMHSDEHFVRATEDVSCSNISDPEFDAELYLQQQMKPRMKPLEKPIDMRRKALDLKGSAVELLEAMLEETDHKTKDLARQIAGGLDTNAIQCSLVDFYHLAYEDKEIKDVECDDNAERALFRSYHILKRLQDFQIGVDDLSKFKKCVHRLKINVTFLAYMVVF